MSQLQFEAAQLATAALKQHQGKENLIAVTLRWDIPDRDTVSMVLGMNSGALNVQRLLFPSANGHMHNSIARGAGEVSFFKSKSHHLLGLENKLSKSLSKRDPQCLQKCQDLSALKKHSKSLSHCAPLVVPLKLAPMPVFIVCLEGAFAKEIWGAILFSRGQSLIFTMRDPGALPQSSQGKPEKSQKPLSENPCSANNQVLQQDSELTSPTWLKKTWTQERLFRTSGCHTNLLRSMF